MPDNSANNSKDAPAPAQELDGALAEPIEVNRNVDCMIYAGRYGKMAGSPVAQFYVTLAFDSIQYARLSAILGSNLKGRMTMHVVNVQAPLPDEEEDDEDNADERSQMRLENAPAIGEVSHIIDGVGQAFRKHGFAPSPRNKDLCTVCGAGKAHDVHAGQKMQSARNAKKADELLPHPYKAREDRAVCVYCDYMEAAEIHDRAKWDQPSPINSDAFPNGAAPSTPDAPGLGDELPRYYQRVAHWLEHEAAGDPLMANELAEEDVKKGLAQPKTPEDQHNLQELEAERAKFLADVPPLKDEELTDEQREAREALAARSAP